MTVTSGDDQPLASAQTSPRCRGRCCSLLVCILEDGPAHWSFCDLGEDVVAMLVYCQEDDHGQDLEAWNLASRMGRGQEDIWVVWPEEDDPSLRTGLHCWSCFHCPNLRSRSQILLLEEGFLPEEHAECSWTHWPRLHCQSLFCIGHSACSHVCASPPGPWCHCDSEESSS